MDSVTIVRTVLEKISAEASRNPSLECCGVLGGADGVITRVYPAANALASATAYEIAPEELFRIFKQIRADGIAMMGIYHSHPRGDNFPSPTDISRAYYPDAAYFIPSPSANAEKPLRAFRIREGEVAELQIIVVG